MSEQPYFEEPGRNSYVDILQNSNLHLHLVLGKFVDYRQFSMPRIQDWVSSTWIKFGEISVQKINNIFLFLCEDTRDRDAIIEQGSMAYQAALIVFKPWTPGVSIRDICFDEAAIWVHLEEVPLNLCDINAVKPMLSLAGKILCTDDTPPGSIKCPIRVKLQIHVFDSLVPGFYLDVGNSQFKWINIRYENLFILCSKCNRVGHKRNACFKTPYISTSFVADSGLCMSDDHFSHNLSNSNIGLKRIERFRTTRVNLQGLSNKPQHNHSIQRPFMCVPPFLSPNSGSFANFLAEASCLSSPVGSDGPDLVSELVCESEDVVPMDCTPPYSPPLMDFTIRDTQVVEEQLTDKGSQARVPHMSSILRGASPEKVHKRVRFCCPAKSPARVHVPTVPPILELQVQESQDSGCFSCWVPNKKRKGVSCVVYSKMSSNSSSDNLMLYYERKRLEVVVTGCLSCLPFKKRKGIGISSSTQMSCFGSSSEGSVAARSRPPGDR